MHPIALAAILFANSVFAGAAGTTMSVHGAGGVSVAVYVAQLYAHQRSPAALILPGCEGFNPRYAAIADGLARAGYAAVALAAAENACTNRSGARTEADAARAALDWIRTQPTIDERRIVLIGYSMGAIAALDLIDSEHAAPAPAGVRGAVAYYPNCAGRSARDLRVPLLILNGSADTVTPPGPCRELALGSRRIAIRTYPGATHAFDVDEAARTFRGSRLAYDRAAAVDAQVQTLTFLLRMVATSGARRGLSR